MNSGSNDSPAQSPEDPNAPVRAYRDLPTRAEIRAAAERFQAKLRVAVDAGANPHQMGLDRKDAQVAFALTLRPEDRATYFRMNAEETEALTAMTRGDLSELKAQAAATNAIGGQIGATIGSVLIVFVLYKILTEVLN